MIFLKNKPEAAKFCDHLTFSLIAHAAKIVARILCRSIEGVLGELQFGFIESKGIKSAIGMVRIISERTLDTDEELLLYVPVTVHREQSVKKEYQQDATI